MQTVIFKMEAFGCPSCVNNIEKVLTNQDGVNKVKVKFFSNKIVIDFEEAQITADKLEQVLTNLGYPVLESKVTISK